MPLWLSITLALIFFFVTTFLLTWAIREGGSFAFLTRLPRKQDAKPPGADQDGPESHS